jgi:regulator of PEP synthase PpsR (kinase-PPPase family)
MGDEIKKIVIVSDGTGKTARRLMDAVLAQYSDHVLFSVVDRFSRCEPRSESTAS